MVMVQYPLRLVPSLSPANTVVSKYESIRTNLRGKSAFPVNGPSSAIQKLPVSAFEYSHPGFLPELFHYFLPNRCHCFLPKRF